MHIPDHFLDANTCLWTGALAAGALTTAVVKIRRGGESKCLPLLAATTAVIFAGQMVNYPISSGTSGHLVGGALAGIVLGPWAGALAMAVVVAVQAVLFADGGLAALGANLLNMAVIAPWVGYALFGLFRSDAGGRTRQVFAAGLAAWGSVLAGAMACSVELLAAGHGSLGSVLPSMLGVHAMIGLGEAAITAAAIALLTAWVPGRQLAVDRAAGAPTVGLSWLGLGAAVAIVVLLAPWASDLPDGLESVASRIGLGEGAAAGIAPLPDYLVPGLTGSFSLIVAGMVGVAVVYLGSRSLQPLLAGRGAK